MGHHFFGETLHRFEHLFLLCAEVDVHDEAVYPGLGVDADPVRAYAWWTLAVEKGESQAETNLAKLSATLTPDQTIEGNALAEEIKVKLERQRLGLPTEDKPDPAMEEDPQAFDAQ